MKVMMRALLAIGLIAGTFGLTGCRWSVGVVIGHDHGRPGDWCGRDRWGRRYCDSYMRAGTNEVAAVPGKFVTTDERVARVSDRYDISHYAATNVVRALILAEKGHMSGFRKIGLSKDDAKRVYYGHKLSERKLNVIGEKLNMTNEDTEDLLNKMADVIRSAQ